MLSFFPRGVLDEILNLIESVSEDFPSYSCNFFYFALFQTFAVWVQNEKTLIYAISDFSKLQYAQKLKTFVQRCVKPLTGKSSGNNTIPIIFFYIKL